MDITERKARAAHRRQSAALHRTTLKRVESDLTPLSGLAAIALVKRLTHESWAAARKPIPAYRREEIPVRFVPGRLVSNERWSRLFGKGCKWISAGAILHFVRDEVIAA
jgi:hypothetical protein